MGFLRFILAFAVVYGHAVDYRTCTRSFYNFLLINASAAVICFFIVSGFYMAYVINEKYKLVDHWQKKFFINRCLRLYPAYFFFLILCLALECYLRIPNFLTGIEGVVGPHRALITFLNFSIIGQDFYALFSRSTEAVMPIAQAWTIAVELELYFLAMLLFSKRNGLFVALMLGINIRFIMARMGFIVSPHGHMLVFNVLIFFAMGGCGYLLFKRIELWATNTRTVVACFLAAALFSYAWYFDNFWHLDARGDDSRFYPFYVGIALITPFIFSISKKSKFDNLLGNLSYPIYLCHILVFTVLRPYASTKYFFIESVCLILALSYFVYRWIEEPVNRVRAQLVKR